MSTSHGVKLDRSRLTLPSFQSENVAIWALQGMVSEGAVGSLFAFQELAPEVVIRAT